MTIATLLFTVGLVYIVGDLMLGMAKQDLMFATLLIAAIVASSAAIAGDVMQDLKTGHMLGATPKRQQVAEIIGVLTGAVVIGPVLSLLHDAFRISQTACQMNPLPNDPTCSKALFAPQAELIGAIVQGAFGGDLNIQMVVLGAAIPSKALSFSGKHDLKEAVVVGVGVPDLKKTVVVRICVPRGAFNF